VPLQAHSCCVPLLLFFLPQHHRVLKQPPSRRVDLPSFPKMPAWVTQQVAYMRGLL
jgi:hypothetical protein